MRQLMGLKALMRWFTIGIIFYLAIMQPRSAGAEGGTCEVPSNSYPTIQSAVDDSQCPVISLVAPQYTEHTVVSRAVLIRGQGATNTIVDGTESGTVFTIQPSGHLALWDMTVANGQSGDGGGIYNDGGDVALLKCVIASNEAPGNGAGIYNAGGRVAVVGCAFVNNLAGNDEGGYGGAIYNEGGAVHIHNTQFNENEAGIYEAIAGGGVRALTHESGGAIYNQGGTITIEDSTFSSNRSVTGGAIYNSSGTLTLRRSTLTGNWSKDGDGGAIRSAGGSVSVHYSLIDGNDAYFGGGGAIDSSGTLYLIGSALSDNGGDWAGGLDQSDGTAVIVGATLVDNYSDEGGTIFGGDGVDITIINSTISGNQGDGVQTAGGTVRLANSTIVFNTGHGLYNAEYLPGTLEVKNSIIAGTAGESACGGNPVTSHGHNIANDATCNLTAVGDQPNTDPLLAPLQDNGGPTLTHALLAGSPAIDMGGNAACPPRDQRGVQRPQDGDGDGVAICDVGAVEMAP